MNRNSAKPLQPLRKALVRLYEDLEEVVGTLDDILRKLDEVIENDTENSSD